jgi:hypothetical protein
MLKDTVERELAPAHDFLSTAQRLQQEVGEKSVPKPAVLIGRLRGSRCGENDPACARKLGQPCLGGA